MIDPVQVWQFEDKFRRLSTRLFDEAHLTDTEIARYEVIRGGLGDVLDGILSGNHELVLRGADAITFAMPRPAAAVEPAEEKANDAGA